MKTHTVSELATILQRSRSSIVCLIQSGRLKAFDAAPGGKHRQWRVTAEALTEFMQQNTAKPPSKKKRRCFSKPVKRYV